MNWKSSVTVALATLLGASWLQGQMRIDGAVPTVLDINTLRFDRANKDVSLSRGAANRLDLATGDSLNLVSGALQVAGSEAISASRLFFASAAGQYTFDTRGRLKASADGVWELYNDAETGFTRLNFGGTTTSFPGLARSATALSLVRADGTGGAMLGHGVEAITVDADTTFAVTSDRITLACTGAETINTITGGVAGMHVTIEQTDTECTIADDDNPTAANAIDLTGTATNDVGAVKKLIVLYYNGTDWWQVAESDN